MSGLLEGTAGVGLCLFSHCKHIYAFQGAFRLYFSLLGVTNLEEKSGGRRHAPLSKLHTKRVNRIEDIRG